MPGAQRDEQMLCVKMYSLPKVKVSRLYTAVSCIFQRETTKPLENQMFFVYSLALGGIWRKVFNFVVFTYWMYTKEVMPRAQRDEQMLCAKMYSLPKIKVSRLYTAVSRCGICLLQCIFQRETTKPLENQMFFVYSLGVGGIWRKSVQFCSFLPIGCIQKKLMPRAQRDEQMVCARMYSLPKVTVSRLYTAVSRCDICSKQMWDLLTAVDISTRNHQTIGIRCSLCIPWVWAGFGGKSAQFCSFYLWDVYKRS